MIGISQLVDRGIGKAHIMLKRVTRKIIYIKKIDRMLKI